MKEEFGVFLRTVYSIFDQAQQKPKFVLIGLMYEIHLMAIKDLLCGKKESNCHIDPDEHYLYGANYV